MNTPVEVPEVATLGSRVRLARIAKGLSGIELAESCGVTRQTVHYWEHHEITDVDSKMALRIAYVLEVRPEWLILGRLPMQPSPKLRELQAVAIQLPPPDLETLLGQGYQLLHAHREALRAGIIRRTGLFSRPGSATSSRTASARS